MHSLDRSRELESITKSFFFVGFKFNLLSVVYFSLMLMLFTRFCSDLDTKDVNFVSWLSFA